MIPKNRIIMASFIVGLVGAGIGGLLIYSYTEGIMGLGALPITLPTGTISGFLSCFFVSIWYLKYMEDESWRRGILFGPLFAGWAGAISGAVTGIGFQFGEMSVNPYIVPSPDKFLGAGAFGIVIGGGTGMVVGLISSLTLGPIIAAFTKKRS